MSYKPSAVWHTKPRIKIGIKIKYKRLSILGKHETRLQTGTERYFRGQKQNDPGGARIIAVKAVASRWGCQKRFVALMLWHENCGKRIARLSRINPRDRMY